MRSTAESNAAASMVDVVTTQSASQLATACITSLALAASRSHLARSRFSCASFCLWAVSFLHTHDEGTVDQTATAGYERYG